MVSLTDSSRGAHGVAMKAFIILFILAFLLPQFASVHGEEYADGTPSIPDGSSGDSLSSLERHIVDMVDGCRAYDYDLALEKIALKHLAFRSAGSAGADEAARWLEHQMLDLGMDAWLEPFPFTSWDLLSKPRLMTDADGDPRTTGDQRRVTSFQPEHFSWPTPSGGVFSELVALPLPEASDYFEVGLNPIETAGWDSIDITGKIVFTGQELRSVSEWRQALIEKMWAQPPAAVLTGFWYEWNAISPNMILSSGGGRWFGGTTILWDLGIPSGNVDYRDSQYLKGLLSGSDVSARMVIDAEISKKDHYNVVGMIEGEEKPEEIVLVAGGHYDTVMSPGFCDNGAGVSGMLEIARVVSEAVQQGLYHPQRTIMFVAFADEEIWYAGSVNFIKRHESEMPYFYSMIDLDCIGSDHLEVSRTEPDDGLDLDQTLLACAQELGVPASWLDNAGADNWPFADPPAASAFFSRRWGEDPGISDTTPVLASTALFSTPFSPSEYWTTGETGWGHTLWDSSRSTKARGWVEAGDLEDHAQVATLAVLRLCPSMPLRLEHRFLPLTLEGNKIGPIAHGQQLPSGQPCHLCNGFVSYCIWNPDEGRRTTQAERSSFLSDELTFVRLCVTPPDSPGYQVGLGKQLRLLEIYESSIHCLARDVMAKVF